MALSRWLLIGGLGLLYAVGSVAFVFGALALRDSTDSPKDVAYTGAFTLESLEITDELVILGEQCNNTDGPLSAVGTASMIRTDIEPNLLAPLFANASRPLVPGCQSTRAEFLLPASVLPGTYTFQLIVQQLGGPPQDAIVVTVQDVQVCAVEGC